MKLNSLFKYKFLNTKITDNDVKIKEMALGYFGGPFLAIISNAIFSSYLNRYYTDIIGWTDKNKFGLIATYLPTISVIFVILGNLIAGRFIDKTRTVQGKARPFILISAPLLVVSIALLFLIPIGSSVTLQVIWIAISYNLYYSLAYPIFYTSHSSLVGLSTRDSHRRGQIATLSNAAAVAAIGFAANILVPIFMQGFIFNQKNGVIDRVTSYNNWKILMIGLCILTFLATVLEYFYTRERITEETIKVELNSKPVSTLTQIKGCISNKYWWLIILYFLFFQLAGMVKNGSMSFYCRWMFNSVTDEASAGVAMGTLGLLGGLPTVLGMFFAWPIAKKLGKKNSIIIGLLIMVIPGSLGFIDVHNFKLISIGRFLRSIGSVPCLYVSLALMSDVLDHLEAKNGFRSDGFTMAVYGSIMVGLMGVGNGVINSLLSFSGYDPLAQFQNPEVQKMLALCFLGIEKISYAILAIFFIFLDVEKHLKEDQAKILKLHNANLNK